MFSNQLWQSSLPLAQVAIEEGKSGMLGYHLAAVAIFSIVGIAVLLVCLVLLEKLTPYSITKEIVDEHNVAMAVVVGAFILGVSMIIAASVVG